MNTKLNIDCYDWEITSLNGGLSILTHENHSLFMTCPGYFEAATLKSSNGREADVLSLCESGYGAISM